MLLPIHQKPRIKKWICFHEFLYNFSEGASLEREEERKRGWVRETEKKDEREVEKGERTKGKGEKERKKGEGKRGHGRVREERGRKEGKR